jgi:hypothetical protein
LRVIFVDDVTGTTDTTAGDFDILVFESRCEPVECDWDWNPDPLTWLYRRWKQEENALLEAYHNYRFDLAIRRMFNTCKAVINRRSLRCNRKGIGLRIKSAK